MVPNGFGGMKHLRYARDTPILSAGNLADSKSYQAKHERIKHGRGYIQQ
jgi:hypothetical protein